MSHFSGSYASEDVQFLLKPAEITPTDVHRKEELIQSGAKHYSEMLSAETVPDDRYMDLYRKALDRNAGRLHADINTLADQISRRPATAQECVIISLARAGTPIGVLLKRALDRLEIKTFHYSVSIIRGRGIDENALRYIKARHGTDTAIFLDGWTGKGSIRGELQRSLSDSDLGFKPFLAVVADPAGCADMAATAEDYVIPSGLLNGIVSGLISRSVLNDDVVGPDDFHACLFQESNREHDISQDFIDTIERAKPLHQQDSAWSPEEAAQSSVFCTQLLTELMAECEIDDVNRIKPGIAEATRAVLRRVPHAVYIKNLDDPEVQHIIHLARQADVPVIQRDLKNYRAVTIIKTLGGEQE